MGGQTMTGDDGRIVCEHMLPQAESDRLCQPWGVTSGSASCTSGWWSGRWSSRRGHRAAPIRPTSGGPTWSVRCHESRARRSLGGSTRPWNGGWQRWRSAPWRMRRRRQVIGRDPAVGWQHWSTVEVPTGRPADARSDECRGAGAAGRTPGASSPRRRRWGAGAPPSPAPPASLTAPPGDRRVLAGRWAARRPRLRPPGPAPGVRHR